MPPLRHLITILTLFTFSLFDPFKSFQVLAQYSQRYQAYNITTGPNFGDWEIQYWWQPTVMSLSQQVALINPITVVLEYNCSYMKEICKNAENFHNGQRGLGLKPLYAFGYDMNTGKGKRNDRRRQRSCPKTTWKNNHACPEPDQVKPMRHVGEWPYTDLEPNRQKGNLNIRNK